MSSYNPTNDPYNPANYNFRNNWGQNGWYGDPYYDGFQKDLSTADTAYKQALARQYINQHKGEDSVAMNYWTGIANNQWGIMGSPSDIVQAGGHTDWGEGDQHTALLQQYANAGVQVSPKMWAAAQYADQQFANSPWHTLAMPTSYNSMGMGADSISPTSSAAGYGQNEGYDYTQQGKQVGQNYQGASADYLNNIQSWKIPSSVGPGANSQISMNSFTGGAPPQGFGGSSSEYQINGDGSYSPINRGPGGYQNTGNGYQFVPQFDPTKPSAQYQPQDGTYKGLQADYNKNALSSSGPMADLNPAMGSAYGAPGTLSTSNTGNDMFAYSNDMTMAPQRKYTTSAKFYSPQTDAFTAGQIGGYLTGAQVPPQRQMGSFLGVN